MERDRRHPGLQISGLRRASLAFAFEFSGATGFDAPRAMFEIEPIDSFQRPDLQPYATMRRPLAHREQGIFVAEGTKVVRRLLESSFEVVSVVLPSKWLPEYEPLLRARPERLRVYLAEKSLLEQLTGYSMFQGVLAIAKVPPPLTLDQALAQTPSPRLLVATEAVANAENVGVLVRNCAAFGAGLLIVGETCASPFLRRAVRNSMGTLFRQPVLESPDLIHTLFHLRRMGIRCLAAHPHSPEATLSRANLRGDCCLLFGSEGDGLSARARAACDDAVMIPMAAGVDSLNVSNAVAVFLYEAARQRGRM